MQSSRRPMDSRALSRLMRIGDHLLPSREGSLSIAPSPASGWRDQHPVRVLITGAAGQIAYSLIFAIARGSMLGPDQRVILHLLDIPPAKKALEGVVMELEDCALPLLAGVVATTDEKEGFSNVDVALLVGAFPRRKGMVRKDLLEKNAAIFKSQGKALNAYASRDVKVVVVGNPANTNALILMSCAPDLPRRNFSALTRLDLNRAKAQISKKISSHSSNVHNVIIWGNHSATQYPDVRHAMVSGVVSDPVRSAVGDDHWLEKEFIPTVQQRGAAIIKARGASSAASAANAVLDHMRSWLLGTRPGEIVSMAVASDGSYGVPKGIIYSFPVTCSGGNYQIVQGLEIDAFSRSKMDATAKELLEEKEAAFAFLGL